MSAKPRPIREGASRSALNLIFLFTVAGFMAVMFGVLFLTKAIGRLDLGDIRNSLSILALALLILALAMSLEVMLFVPFAAYLRKRRFKLLSFAGFTNPGAGAGWLSVAAAFILFIANIALINVFTPLFQLAGITPPPDPEPVIPVHGTAMYILVLLVEVALVASVPAILEEFVFRGVLFRTMGASWRTAWVSAALFALMHVDLVTLPSKMAMGFALAAAFLLTRSLWAPVIMHFLNNTLAVVTERFIPMVSVQDASWQRDIVIWAGIAVVSGATLFGLLFVLKKVRERRDAAIRRRIESMLPAEKLGFEYTYIEPPVVASFGNSRALHTPLWIAGGILAASTALMALGNCFHWFHAAP